MENLIRIFQKIGDLSGPHNDPSSNHSFQKERSKECKT